MRTSRLFSLLMQLSVAGVLLSWVAWYNRFPLMYYDTGGYLRSAYAFTHSSRPLIRLAAQIQRSSNPAIDQQLPQPADSQANPFFMRPPGYTVFLVPFANPTGIYVIPFVQGLVTALLLILALRCARLSLPVKARALLLVMLSAFTSLPWVAGEIMPDVFTGLVVLAAFALTLGVGELSRVEKAIVSVVSVGLLCSHLSHLPLYAGLISLAFLYQLFLDRGAFALKQFAIVAAGPLIVAAFLLCASNFLFSRHFVLSESSDLFYLGRLVGAGTAQEYLEETCPIRSWVLCKDRKTLVADEEVFLWSPAGAWKTHQDDPRFLREAHEIVHGTLASHWPEQFRHSVITGLHQLVTCGLEPSLRPHGVALLNELMTTFGQGALNRFKRSRQSQGTLPLAGATVMQVGAVGLSVLVLACGCPLLIRRRRRKSLQFIVALVCGVCLNAAIIGALSEVHARYQSRVVWLIPLAAFVAAWETLVSPRGPSASTDNKHSHP